MQTRACRLAHHAQQLTWAHVCCNAVGLRQDGAWLFAWAAVEDSVRHHRKVSARHGWDQQQTEWVLRSDQRITHDAVNHRWENQLIGWTSSADPLENVARASLFFYSKEAAMDFCKKHGWEYTVDEPNERSTTRSPRFNAYGACWLGNRLVRGLCNAQWRQVFDHWTVLPDVMGSVCGSCCFLHSLTTMHSLLSVPAGDNFR